MQSKGETQHKTVASNSFAHEQTGNWYYLDSMFHTYPIVSEGLRALPEPTNFAPLTTYNNWPDTIPNASIFFYLMPSEKMQQDYPTLCKFVQDWYSCSCAIIYALPNGKYKIIGSGCLTDKKDKKYPEDYLYVSTAKHNFQDIPCERLFVRFFNYKFEMNYNKITILEDYLDMPVIKAQAAEKGLDAGYLILPKLQDKAVSCKYMKQLPIPKDSPNEPLSSGHYIMFHFAGGYHQISLGQIEHFENYNFNDDVFLQAGPGASGATLIWHVTPDQTRGEGISIYRIMENGSPQRRLIAFSEFVNGPRWPDNIRAPYSKNPNLQIISVNDLNKNSYELLPFREEAFGHEDQRPKHPNDSEYNVNDHHSNHHIIPIADLLFLWQYFHNVVDMQGEICAEVDRDIKDSLEVKRKESFAVLKGYPIEEQLYHWKKHSEQMNKEEEKLSDKDSKEDSYKKKLNQKVMERYEKFHLILVSLCSPNSALVDRGNFEEGEAWFSWAWWNLFKGWGTDYRRGDPGRSGIDRSEKHPPLNFNRRLWECLKSEPDGLYRKIQQLKESSKKPISKSCRQQIEESLYESLQALDKEWSKLNESEQKIHPYNEEEWVCIGKYDGHPIWKLKTEKDLEKDLSDKKEKILFPTTKSPKFSSVSQQKFLLNDPTSHSTKGLISVNQSSLNNNVFVPQKEGMKSNFTFLKNSMNEAKEFKLKIQNMIKAKFFEVKSMKYLGKSMIELSCTANFLNKEMHMCLSKLNISYISSLISDKNKPLYKFILSSDNYERLMSNDAFAALSNQQQKMT